jgi:hypothetical protein
MTTHRHQLTTYVDEATAKWVRAAARREVRTVSQFLAALLAQAAGTGAPVQRPALAARPVTPPPPVARQVFHDLNGNEVEPI